VLSLSSGSSIVLSFSSGSSIVLSLSSGSSNSSKSKIELNIVGVGVAVKELKGPKVSLL
jgi:hypothetical protein